MEQKSTPRDLTGMKIMDIIETPEFAEVYNSKAEQPLPVRGNYRPAPSLEEAKGYFRNYWNPTENARRRKPISGYAKAIVTRMNICIGLTLMPFVQKHNADNINNL